MATLMDFAAMQLERGSYSSRTDFPVPDDDTISHRPPILHLSKQVRDTMTDGVLTTPLLIIGIEGGGADILQLLVNIDSWDEIGCLALPEQSMRGTSLEPAMQKGVCSIWRAKGSDNGIILVHAAQSVPAYRANAWASKLLSTISAQKVLILDTIKAFEVGLSFDDVPSPILRVLQAKGDQGDVLGPPNPVLGEIQPLETGAVTQGCAAAVLTRCLLKRISCALLLVVIPDIARHASELANAAHGHIAAVMLRAATTAADGSPLLHSRIAPAPAERAQTIGSANPLYV